MEVLCSSSHNCYASSCRTKPITQLSSNLHPTLFLPISTRKASRLILATAKAAKQPLATEPTSSTPIWVAEFLSQIQRSPKKGYRNKSDALEEDDDSVSMEWCTRARKSALKTIHSRGLSAAMEALVSPKKKKKKKKLVSSKKKKNSRELEGFSDDEEGEVESSSGGSSQLQENIVGFYGGMFEEKKFQNREAFLNKLSQLSGGPSDRKKEIALNKSLVDALTAEDVLEAAFDAISAVAKGLKPSPLTPLNIATALHRIAKNMEKASAPLSRRLAFARQREMSMLVGIAISALPDCSAQGVSNIAWALSKIGGELLYLSEMDRLAEIAVTKVGEFNAQNVANVAGAFASMRQASPELFSVLSLRASQIASDFSSQELSQLLWASASLYEHPKPLLDAIDTAFEGVVELNLSDDNEEIDDIQSGVRNFNRKHLGAIAWSYAVHGQMNRSFPLLVWNALIEQEEKQQQRVASDEYREDVMFAWQVHQVNLCLKLEHPNLGLTLRGDVEEKIVRAVRSKRFNQKITSSFQKEVMRLLTSTGLEWVREYVVDGYTLDAVVIDRKVALEIDGPTHFSRNLDTPLGHTMLKRRYMSAAGWKLASVCHHEWEELQGGFEQLEYLTEILKDCIDL